MISEQVLVSSMFGCFFLFLLMGLPVAWALSAAGFLFAIIGFLLVEYFNSDIWFTWQGTIGSLDARIYGLVANELLVALPMFIFMGIMLDRSGVAEKLMHSLTGLFSTLKGGYAVSVVIVGILLAASTGIVGASVVLLGMLSIGPMLSQSYNKGLAVGTASAVGVLGVIIPPSIMLVLLADRLGTPEASVGRLFMAAVVPGLLLAFGYILYIVTSAYLRPSFAPSQDTVRNFSIRYLIGFLRAALPALALIFGVLGSIVSGIATTTEASAIGAAGALGLAGLNKQLNIMVVSAALHQTSRTIAFIFGIFLGATVFASVLRGVGGDDVIRNLIIDLPFGATGVVICILLLTFVLGFFLDWIEITLIVLPLVAPTVFSLGVDPVWFAVLFALCLQTSFLTPPVGPALFYIKGVCPTAIKTRDIYTGVFPFIIIQLLVLFAVFVLDDLATWLPDIIHN